MIRSVTNTQEAKQIGQAGNEDFDGSGLTYSHFFESIFELTDENVGRSDEVTPEKYSEFIRTLHAGLLEELPDGECRPARCTMYVCTHTRALMLNRHIATGIETCKPLVACVVGVL